MAKRRKAAKKKKATKRRRLIRGPWSASEVRVLRQEFPGKSCAEVAGKLGRPLYAVKKKAYRLGIYKAKRYLKSIGRA